MIECTGDAGMKIIFFHEIKEASTSKIIVPNSMVKHVYIKK